MENKVPPADNNEGLGAIIVRLALSNNQEDQARLDNLLRFRPQPRKILEEIAALRDSRKPASDQNNES